MSKVFIITGSSKGIGKALCEYYLNAGNIVVGCSRGDSTISHSNYSHFSLSVANEKAVANMVKEVKQQHGKIDVLINNAGTASMNHLMLTPTKTYDKVMDTNLKGTFLFSRECAKAMMKTGGKIINLSSVAVPLALEGEAIYAASKAAIETLTKVMAKEVAPMNITVNAVGPGPIETDLLRGVSNEKKQALLNQLPSKSLGTEQEVIEAIEQLLNSNETGEIIYLGGL